MSKLTLNINDDTITWAKEYASRNNRSLSSFIESLLEAVKVKHEFTDDEITSFVKSMMSETSLPSDSNTDDYFEHLLKKHQ